MRQIIEYADIVNEPFTHHLASSSGAGELSKRLSVQVSFMPTKVIFVVRVDGEIQYEGDNLKDAVITYNTF